MGAPPSLTTINGRLTGMVQENIADPWPDLASAWGMASYALSAFHLGTDLTNANGYINSFYSQFPVPDSDTIDFESYFKLHLIWRIYCDPAMSARLTPVARTNIESMMWRWLRTRSKLSAAQGTEWVYHGSENHDAMQKGGFLLCAEALKDVAGYGPNRVLADGSTIAQHAAAWSGYFRRYFPGRAREGVNVEIGSPTYAKYSVGVYYNIMDFAESAELRELARQFISLYWADTASDWTRSGVRGGGQARCYKDSYLRLGGQYSFNDLLWGYGWHGNAGVVRTYGLIPATSSYRVPEIIAACAADTNRPNYLYSSRRWGRAGVVDADDNNFVVFDNGNSSIRRETWVTPDYTMGAITLDMNKAYVQVFDQNRAMGVIFASGVNDRVMVFGKGAVSDDKSYADLNGVCRTNCMVVQRDKNANNSGNGTLIFVSQGLWTNRVETGGWLFLRSSNAYCAIKPAVGGYTAVSAEQGYDLELGDLWAPVVVQTGQASGYADFAAFQTSVMSNTLTYALSTLNYTSEAGDTFTVYANSKTTPRVNGATVALNPIKTYDSPYLSMVHGEDIATVRYPGYPNLTLDFGVAPVLTSLVPLDNASVLVSGNLSATFDKPVQAGTGFIFLKRASDGSTVESFNVASSSRLTFSGTRLTINPTANLAPGVNYYVTIAATAVEDLSGRQFGGIANSVGWTFTAAPFTTLNTASKVEYGPLGGGASTLPFDAGATADLLVVALSHEKSGGTYSVSYGGVSLSSAVLGGPADIWYLDLTTTSYAGGAANLVVNYTGTTTVNGVGIGVVSVTSGGLPLALHSTAMGVTGANTVSLTTSLSHTLNVVSFNANGSGAVSVDAPLTSIYANGDIGSARGAAGFETGVPAGVHGYSWTTGEARKAVAAAFVVQNFSNWIALYPGVGTQTGLGDDPDGDGHKNGVENFFGTSPSAFSQGLVARTANGNTFTFTHPRNPTPASDLAAAYRWSKDLVTSQAAGATDNAGTKVAFTTQPDTPAPGMTTVTATVTGTQTNRLFVIVQVTE